MIKNKVIILALIIVIIFSACGKQNDVEVNPDTNNPPGQSEQNKDADNNTNQGSNVQSQDKHDNSDDENKQNGDNEGKQNNDNKQNNDTDEKRIVEEIIIAETLSDYLDDRDQTNRYIDSNVAGKLKFVSGKEILRSFEQKKIKDEDGVLLSDIIDFMKMADSNSYIITSVSNSSIGVTKSDCQKGILYIDNNGDYAVKFEELSDRTNIKRIISISIDK